MKFDELTKEELIEYINNLGEELNGKYGLVWDKEKEPEKIVVDCDKMIPILKEIDTKNINKGGVDNILIEGDNFHALSILNYTHRGSVDVIYIDPPYNTGHEDFMYNDKYIDLEDGYRHSKWLNFMEKRLKIAKNLLTENGLIFISIDDNELYQLKLLCDKVFGDNRFLCNITVETSNGVFGLKAKHVNKTIVKCKDYLLVYAMNKENLDLNPLYTKSKASFDTHFTYYKNDKIECNLIDYLKENDLIKEKSKKHDLSISLGNLSKLMDIDEDVYKLIISESEHIFRIRDYTLSINEKNRQLLKDGQKHRIDDFYVFINEENQLLYLYPFSKLVNLTSDYNPTICSSVILGDLWKGFNDDMGNVGKEGGVDFKNGKKPVRLIKNILKMINKKDAVVLDFFAGSGTTGQAVLELNNEDSGNRRFILCTNNENKICEDKTYKRVKNIMCGYNNYSALNNNLRYYKCEFVDYAGTRDQLYYDLTEKCVPMLCVKSNTYELVEKNKEFAIYSNLEKTEYSCVYFDIFGESYNSFINTVKEIKEHKNLYIFSLNEYVNEEIFKGISNYSIEAIPYKILDLYKNVVKMSKEN